MNKFFASLKRIFEPRTQAPPDTVAQPTADRPPPPQSEPPREEATPVAVPAPDDVSEVRALLEAVAEAPVSAPEAEAASAEELVDIPTAAPDLAEDALVLTLATPAATFAVAKAAATIGRGQENTVRLDDLSVSRRHARIAYRQGGYWLSDLGSMGGTWVDGTRLSAPHRLAAGQVIDIGLCRLTVSATGRAATADGTKSASLPRAEVAGQTRRRR